jgi:hypothetical protein
LGTTTTTRRRELRSRRLIDRDEYDGQGEELIPGIVRIAGDWRFGGGM